MGDAKVVVEFFFLSYIILEILGREFFLKLIIATTLPASKLQKNFFKKLDFFVCVKIDKRGEIPCIELIAGVYRKTYLIQVAK